MLLLIVGFIWAILFFIKPSYSFITETDLHTANNVYALHPVENDMVFAGEGVSLKPDMEYEAFSCHAGSAGPYWLVVPPGVFRMGAEPGPDVLRPGRFRNYDGPDWEFAAHHAERLGLAGMCDAIQEWCHDWWVPYNPDKVTGPLGYKKGDIRVARGGGNGSERTETVDIEVNGVVTEVTRKVTPRITDRSGNVHGDRSENLSFRLVRGKLPDGIYRSKPPLPAGWVNQQLTWSMLWKTAVTCLVVTEQK